jgi:PKD domain
MRIPAFVLVLTAMLVVAAPAAAHPGPGNSAATITGSFADGCRDFTARSSKDISHVKLRYVDGRVVKDETINRPDYSIDGDTGDELDDAIVKSGTTWQRFKCPRTAGPPTAVLEIQTPPLADCTYNTSEYPSCLATDPRTVWSRPPEGDLAFVFVFPLPPEIRSFSFRGTSSTDPDSDIVSWSIDLGDGTSAGGSWTTEPPTEITHTYPPFGGFNPFALVTLTVTDSAGQSDSDTISLIGIDGSLD